MANNALLRQKIAEVQAQVQSEKEWWEKRRASIQTEFMKELDDESPATKEKGALTNATSKLSDDDEVIVEGGQQSGRRKKGKK